MTTPESDDGLVHGHDWASERARHDPAPRPMPKVADAASLTTPSCVFQDDRHFAD